MIAAAGVTSNSNYRRSTKVPKCSRRPGCWWPVFAATEGSGGGREMCQTNSEDGIRDLLARAEKGDQTALPELRRLLQQHGSIRRRYADLGRLAEDNLIGFAAGDNLALAESLRLALAELKRDLAGESPSPAEKLLVERAALS